MKILIVDDHSLIRTGLTLLLQTEPTYEVCGEASSGEEALSFLETHDIALMIMDISMPGMGGLEGMRQARSRWPELKIIALSMHEDLDYILQALRAGANGYISKTSADTELLTALETVRQGKIYLNARIEQQVLQAMFSQGQQVAKNPKEILSQREFEIFMYLVRGYTITEIAENLHLSVKTVDTHKTRLMEKLECSRKNELVEKAIAFNLLKG